MKYRHLGKSGIQVSELSFGSWVTFHNQAGIDFDVEEVEGGYDIFPDQETLLGRVTSVGITLSF